MTSRYVAITVNKDGKIEIFYKYIQDRDTKEIEQFEQEVKGWHNNLLCIYNEDDVIMKCAL